ncbi:glycosyltransferase family 4 protein [Oscillochloris sp. ZM17-4]|uniref:glycosyltransferase family 4 protein n=1 Tax=Oscillochloris sp. ZM17-4 TaxID=2866714 RepID=UPI001C73A276|nr:glycosyltransferase family 4 protein [Oscillochloris sp. ZM17-4]MBX0328807.1 glycosyltransferase family 4 protein [Oscillochloris sp. ZM17-4]
MNNQVLLTVSGTIAADIDTKIAAGSRPRADYRALAEAFGADLLDYPAARGVAGSFGKALERIGGPDLMLAWACFMLRHRYKVIVTDGEQIGLPLATLLKFLGPGRRPRHLMIAHIISVPKKMIFLDRLGVQSHIDRFLVYATAQKQFIERRWKIPSARVVFTPFMVDSDFFAPDHVQANDAEPMICAVGLERRDYPTLLKAVAGLPAKVIIAAASPWSKRSDTTEGQDIPSNVEVRRFTQYELRQLYADSRFLVMPLENVEFQAGITAILEAMSMERAVVCSRTTGQTDAIIEGETGTYVPPKDPESLRAAMEHLLWHPEEAERMGKAGRRIVLQHMSLDSYAERLGQLVREVLAEAEGGTSKMMRV